MTTSLPSGTTYQAVLGAVIQQLRRPTPGDHAIKITQSAVAEQLGITVSTWSRIERGDSALSLEQLLALAAYLEVPLSELFKAVEEKVLELKNQGVHVGISKAALADHRVVELSIPQLTSIASFALMPTGALVKVGYAAYQALVRRKGKSNSG